MDLTEQMGRREMARERTREMEGIERVRERESGGGTEEKVKQKWNSESCRGFAFGDDHLIHGSSGRLPAQEAKGG